MSSHSQFEERLTAIESLLMHIQHDIEQLHDVALGQQRDLDELRKLVARLQSDVERIELGPETRDPKAEKPPHY